MSNFSEVDAVIVGAGLAGLYQLHRLRNLGLSTRVIEAADGVGGTWLLNRYPGARCDIQSMTYSYSFAPEVDQEWSWTEKFASQPEILRYINHVADRFDLRKHITFTTRVTSALYNESLQRWDVHTDHGETINCQFLIMAVGCLSALKMPEIPGIERFQGPSYHTGQWPQGGVDFSGQRVAVIGTGSSAVQSIPIIAQQASELTVFQRTPCFAMPAFNRPLTADEITSTKANYPALRAAQRNSGGGFMDEQVSPMSALEVSDEDRQARYEALWNWGSLNGLWNAYSDIMINKESNDTVAEFIRQKIRTVVKDPETAETLTPRTYAFGSKRPCLHTGFYETFNQQHVHLVDLNKTPIVEVTEKGIRTALKEHEVDAIVYATGYDAITGALTRVDIQGRNGTTLKAKWAKPEGARSYLGIGIAGFPNLFIITGPFSPNVLSCMTVSIEQHVDWITDCIAYLRARGVGAIEARADAEDAWVAHARTVANFTLFPTGSSYYTGANVPGKPRHLLAYIGGVGPYRLKCSEVAAKGYEGFTLTPASSRV